MSHLLLSFAFSSFSFVSSMSGHQGKKLKFTERMCNFAPTPSSTPIGTSQDMLHLRRTRRYLDLLSPVGIDNPNDNSFANPYGNLNENPARTSKTAIPLRERQRGAHNIKGFQGLSGRLFGLFGL